MYYFNGYGPTPKFFKTAILVAVVFTSLAFFRPFKIISAGHVGVVTTLGSVNPEYLTEGFHLVNPISAIHQVEVRLVKAELKNSSASTRDLQTVHTDLVVSYRIDGKQAPNIYKNFGSDLENKVIFPAINEVFKATTAKFDSEELITKRDIVSNEIHQALSDKLTKYGLDVSDISLVNFGFSREFENAIENKVIATQKKQQAEQDLQRITIEAEQAVAKAKGEAEAIRIQSQAIQSQGGQSYVQLQAINKWDGKLPYYTGNQVPFINLQGK